MIRSVTISHTDFAITAKIEKCKALDNSIDFTL